jgi:C4-dicarboxylate transporter DctM subunit
MLAGTLMDRGGMSKRIVDFATELFCFVRGSLAMITVLASMIFAGVSGSSTADTAAIGSIMLPTMKERGYNMKFSTALQAAAGSIGPVIPPSILMIFIGCTTNTSIAKLFLGGIVPGVLIGIGLMVVSYFHARRGGDAYLSSKTFNLKRVFKATIKAIPGLGLPVIIIGGIVGGIFTATEAAVVAVVYGFLVGMFIYRELKIVDLPGILIKSIRTATIIMFLISTAFLFSWMITVLQISTRLTAFMFSHVSSAFGFFVFFNILLLIVGMFMESFSAIILLSPLLFPIAQSYGINPVHFGVVMCVNLAIGYITPPYGATLYVSCSLSGKTIREVTPYILPIFISMLFVLIIITYFPQSFMWIPDMMK